MDRKAGTLQATSLWFQKPGRAVLRDEELAEVPEGWCLVESLFSAISPGTERLVFLGGVPREVFARMKHPYMGGEFSFPVKYGYSLVGRIVDGPDERIGQTVHVLHPHQDRCVVKSEDAFPVPDEVPPERASLASSMETAVNAIWDSQAAIGECALVVGFGIIGSLVARLLESMPGLKVTVTDIDSHKLTLAGKLGFEARQPNDVSGSFDLAFHASGSPGGLQLALDRVGFEGRVVELSWYGTKKTALSLGGSFHPMRKKILSSQVSSLPSRFRSNWDLKKRKSLVFDLLKNEAFDSHITHRFPFGGLPRVFEEFKTAHAPGLSYLVVY